MISEVKSCELFHKNTQKILNKTDLTAQKFPIDFRLCFEEEKRKPRRRFKENGNKIDRGTKNYQEIERFHSRKFCVDDFAWAVKASP